MMLKSQSHPCVYEEFTMSVFPIPVLVVDPRAIQQGSEKVLSRAHALQHQADPIQRRQQEEDERKQEAAVIGLPHAAVYPTPATTDGRHKHTSTHTGRQNIVLRPQGYTTHRHAGTHIEV